MKTSIASASRFFVLPALCAALAACGGGSSDGGDSGGTPLAVPVAAAMSAYLAQSGTQQVSGSGTINGVSGNASGTITRDVAVTASFEGKAAWRQRNVVSLTLSNDAGTGTAGGTSFNYFDSGYTVPVGSTADGLYAVTTASKALPASAQVGDTGSWYAMDSYTSSAKAVRTGANTVSYAVQADSSSTVLLAITNTSTPVAGNATVTTTTFRVGATGAAVPVKEVTSGPGVSTTLNYR